MPRRQTGDVASYAPANARQQFITRSAQVTCNVDAAKQRGRRGRDHIPLYTPPF